MDPTPRRRRHSKEFNPPDMSGDSSSIFSPCLPECDRYLKRLRTAKEEILRRQERLTENIRGLFGFSQREEEEKLREVNAATIRFFLEFDWVFKEENPLITGHLTGIAVELDKVIMKATMAKQSIFSSCLPECDSYLKRLQTAKEEILRLRRLDRLRKNYWGIFMSCSILHYSPWKEEEERLRKEKERLKEVNAATIGFFLEFDWVFKEENPLITGHLTGIAVELDKVIMKATMAKWSSCVPECDRYLKRLQTAEEEILSIKRLDRLRENILGIFSSCVPDFDRYLKRLRLRREEILSIKRLDRLRKNYWGIFRSCVTLHYWLWQEEEERPRKERLKRLKLLYEQERYKMTPILLSAPKRVSREDFSIPSFVQLRRQANLSRSTPHSHDLGGADTGEALLPPVLVSTLKDALADLSLVGGGSLDETIRRILQAVLKDEVASELYWAGHGSKQSFQQANLQEVIFRASGNRYSGEAAFADVGPHQHQLQLQHQQCMLVKAF